MFHIYFCNSVKRQNFSTIASYQYVTYSLIIENADLYLIVSLIRYRMLLQVIILVKSRNILDISMLQTHENDFHVY